MSLSSCSAGKPKGPLKRSAEVFRVLIPICDFLQGQLASLSSRESEGLCVCGGLWRNRMWIMRKTRLPSHGGGWFFYFVAVWSYADQPQRTCLNYKGWWEFTETVCPSITAGCTSERCYLVLKILQFQSAQKPLLTGTNVCVITCVLCSRVALYILLSLGIPSLKGQLAISPLFLCGVCIPFFFSFRFVLILCMCGFFLHACTPCLHLIPVEIRNE